MTSVVMGIDIEIGSPNNPSYAVYCANDKNSGPKTYTDVHFNELRGLIAKFKPQIIASDNIKELLITKSAIQYFCELQENVELIQITATHPAQMTSVLHEARKLGIPLKNKPWPLQTAIICSILALKRIGSRVFLSDNGNKLNIKYKTLNQSNTGKTLKNVLKIDPTKEMTERETHKLLSEHPMIEELIGIIASGKESNIFLGIDKNGDKIIIKSFKSYTSVADIVRSVNYHVKADNAAMILAKKEEKNLRIFEKFGISAPHVKFRDGSLIGMTPIAYEDGLLVRPLSEKKSFKSKSEMEFVLDQILNTLHLIFKKCKMVHGDYSANNILYNGDKIYVIDVSQANFVNFNTFTETPIRIRFDNALNILFRDLYGIISFFEKKYRVTLETDIIVSQFIELIPVYFKNRVDSVITKYK